MRILPVVLARRDGFKLRGTLCVAGIAVCAYTRFGAMAGGGTTSPDIDDALSLEIVDTGLSCSTSVLLFARAGDGTGKRMSIKGMLFDQG